MDQNNITKATDILNTMFYGKHPSMPDIDGMLSKLRILFPDNSDEENEEAIRQYKIKIGISMDPGELLSEKHQDDKWFEQFQEKGSFPYYDRYRDYLKNGRHMSEAVIESTKKNNYLTIRNFADPTSTDQIARKGLVVGDVQAGKTLNYIGLMNLAVDVGYKNIILLTGTTEELRKQTQHRVDEGFIGAYSETLLTDSPIFCGVSNNQNKYFAITLTSFDCDFSASSSRAMAFKLSSLDLPKIFIIKKNARVLEQVFKMVNKDADILNKDSVLIIDDECDYASLNTKKDEDPTAINSAIRRLLGLYAKSTYVGYSATPFANIFVNPEAEYGDDDGKVPDLFPSDFIVLLESPNNYIGAKDMFLGFDETYDDNGEVKDVGHFSPYIHLIGDHFENDGTQVIDHNFLAAKHKKDTPYLELADSLKKAIKVFLLSSCVYSLRGYEKEHRTMLINISRFNDLQESIGYQVRSYLNKLRNAIDGSVRMSDEFFNADPMLSDLEPLWENDIAFSRGSVTRGLPPNREYTFKQIKSVLKDEIDKMEAFVTNTRHKKDRLDYKKYKGIGVRGIVIGGFTLSRGLTLIGLMTSYYNRNAMAYDTLVQMGRWFGYRDGYDDLINIYMTQSSIDAFCAASDATEDLKVQFRKMAEEGKKPIDFGLMVREAPSTLENIPLVTARNKQKNTEEYIRSIQLTAKSIDTSKIFKSRTLNEKNGAEIQKFLDQISVFPLKYAESGSGRAYYDSVPKSLVCGLLDRIHVSDANKTFNCHILSEFISGNNALDTWYVIVPTGSKNKPDPSESWNDQRPNGLKSPMDGPCVKRSFDVTPSFDEEDFLRVGGAKNAIVDPNIYATPLTKAQIEAVRAKYKEENPKKKGNPAARYWLQESQKPFLLIYPIDLKPTDKANKGEFFSTKKARFLTDTLNNEIVYGFALGFPGKVQQVLKVKYRINMVKQRELQAIEDDGDEDAESDEDSEQTSVD